MWPVLFVFQILLIAAYFAFEIPGSVRWHSEVWYLNALGCLSAYSPHQDLALNSPQQNAVALLREIRDFRHAVSFFITKKKSKSSHLKKHYPNRDYPNSKIIVDRKKINSLILKVYTFLINMLYQDHSWILLETGPWIFLSVSCKHRWEGKYAPRMTGATECQQLVLIHAHWCTSRHSHYPVAKISPFESLRSCHHLPPALGGVEHLTERHHVSTEEIIV